MFTNKGRNLQAKAQTGVQLQFTKISLGDGALNGSAIADLTNLKNTIVNLPIERLRTLSGGRAEVAGILSNQSLTSGFYYRELGLFALDPQEGEILYCYGNSGNLAEYIPASGGADVIEKQIVIQTIVGNATNITAVIDTSLVYATVSDMNLAIQQNLTDSKAYTNTEIDLIEQQITDLENQLGLLTSLETEQKANLVAAINELKSSLTTHLAESSAHVYYADDTGSANAKAVAISPVTVYVKGLGISFTNKTVNTDAATLNVNGLGAIPILKSNGSALTSGNLKANSVYTVRYNGTSFILQGEGGEYGTATAGDVLVGTTIGTEKGLVNGALALTGNATAAQVLSGQTFYNSNAKIKLTGTMPSKAAATITPGTTDQTIAGSQYLSGIQTILGDADLVASNIKNGVTIFGVGGSAIVPVISPGIAMSVGFAPSAIPVKSSNYYFEQSKLKEITVKFSGTVRVRFNFVNGNYGAVARIYVNDVARGIRRDAAYNINITYDEDLFVNAGDKVQIYAAQENSGALVSQFSLNIADTSFSTVTL